MAKVINFPCYLENTIRLANATHWTPTKKCNRSFTLGELYQLQFNEMTEEWYVFDNQGHQNYAFYALGGKYINILEIK